jgi:hypothetical protein
MGNRIACDQLTVRTYGRQLGSNSLPSKIPTKVYGKQCKHCFFSMPSFTSDVIEVPGELFFFLTLTSNLDGRAGPEPPPPLCTVATGNDSETRSRPPGDFGCCHCLYDIVIRRASVSLMGADMPAVTRIRTCSSGMRNLAFHVYDPLTRLRADDRSADGHNGQLHLYRMN